MSDEKSKPDRASHISAIIQWTRKPINRDDPCEMMDRARDGRELADEVERLRAEIERMKGDRP